jgi:prevent-host-death family protein
VSSASVGHRETVDAAELRERCGEILDRVSPEGILITKDGEPVAMMVPVQTAGGELIGSLAGKIRVKGDLMPPVWPVPES